MLRELVQDIETTGRYLRKSDRLRHEDIHPLRRVTEMLHMGWSKREIYEAGRQDGESAKPMNLTDLLFCMSMLGFGKAKVVQESKSHVIIHVYQCLCHRYPYGDENRCIYVAGFICGAFNAMAKVVDVSVREARGGGSRELPCVFVASW